MYVRWVYVCPWSMCMYVYEGYSCLYMEYVYVCVRTWGGVMYICTYVYGVCIRVGCMDVYVCGVGVCMCGVCVCMYVCEIRV